MTSTNPNWAEMSDDLKIIEMMADGFDHVDTKIQAITQDIQDIRESLSSLETMLGDPSRLNDKSIVDTLNTIVEMLETTQANVSASQQK